MTFLKQKPLSLTEAYRFIQEWGSEWSIAQLQLFCSCMGDLRIDLSSPEEPVIHLGEKSPEQALLDAMIDIVRSNQGNPIPAAQVLRLLPSQFTTTEVQIKALAKNSSELEVFGPGLLRCR